MKPVISVPVKGKAIETAGKILGDTYTVFPEIQNKTTHLLLNVPSLNADGSVKGAGDLSQLLQIVPMDVTIVGGNLRHPKLMGFKTIDLLEDSVYLHKNAAITAQCALRYALTDLSVVIEGCPVLILGWGRIAKQLAFRLKMLGAKVSIAARKVEDRAMASAFGLCTLKLTAIDERDYALIYNTIPYPVLPDSCSDTVKVDLASTPGMEGTDVIFARGLPGRFAPESSGKLIAERVNRILKREETSIW